VQTKKIILREKGHDPEYREIEVPTNEAMIEVAQRLHAAGVPQVLEVDGWGVKYGKLEPIRSGPVRDPFVNEEPLGPWRETPQRGALCIFGNQEWFATFAWLRDEDVAPIKMRVREGTLTSRPIVIQESLLDWRPPLRPSSSPSSPAESSSGVSPFPEDERHEGARLRVTTDRYERDAVARATCIEHYGAACVVCGFDFGKTYGSAAEGFIHVHHLRPLSADGEDHPVDPIADLRPLCPNCHHFVHMETPPINVERARAMVIALRGVD
jgi:hypothetical protein